MMIWCVIGNAALTLRSRLRCIIVRKQHNDTTDAKKKPAVKSFQAANDADLYTNSSKASTNILVSFLEIFQSEDVNMSQSLFEHFYANSHSSPNYRTFKIINRSSLSSTSSKTIH